jgi:GNAT superfamily N-acetyltransferase
MAAEFWQHAGFNVPYKLGSAQFYINIAHDQGLLIVAEKQGQKEGQLVGFAAGAKAPLMGNSDFSVGSELAWWIQPEHRGGKLGIQLLKALEQAAKAAGCDFWSMLYMESSMPDTIKQMYQKMGYKLQETSYLKPL